MSVIAEFTIPAEALPFGETLAGSPGARIELERIVPADESTLPFFWVWGREPTAFVEAAESEPNIADVRLLDRVEGGALYRAEWTPDAEIIDGIERLDATIVDATATAEHWRFQVRAQEHDAFNRFRTVFDEQGIPVHLNRLYDLSELVEGEHRSLTPEQREVLIAAYRDGYFDEPRAISQEELGEQFDISGRAVSERLRRGIRNFVGAALLPSGKRE